MYGRIACPKPRLCVNRQVLGLCCSTLTSVPVIDIFRIYGYPLEYLYYEGYFAILQIPSISVILSGCPDKNILRGVAMQYRISLVGRVLLGLMFSLALGRFCWCDDISSAMHVTTKPVPIGCTPPPKTPPVATTTPAPTSGPISSPSTDSTTASGQPPTANSNAQAQAQYLNYLNHGGTYTSMLVMPTFNPDAYATSIAKGSLSIDTGATTINGGTLMLPVTGYLVIGSPQSVGAVMDHSSTFTVDGGASLSIPAQAQPGSPLPYFVPPPLPVLLGGSSQTIQGATQNTPGTPPGGVLVSNSGALNQSGSNSISPISTTSGTFNVTGGTLVSGSANPDPASNTTAFLKGRMPVGPILTSLGGHPLVSPNSIANAAGATYGGTLLLATAPDVFQDTSLTMGSGGSLTLLADPILSESGLLNPSSPLVSPAPAASVSSVPEPGTLVLLAVAASAGACFWRRRGQD